VSICLSIVKIIHLIDRTDLFKTGNLVLGGKEIVTSRYSRLERQRQRGREPVGRVQVLFELRQGKRCYLSESQ